MAVIFTYPPVTGLNTGDLLLISEASKTGNPTKTVTIGKLAQYIGPLLPPSGAVTGTGTTNTLPIWTDGPNGTLGDSLISQPLTLTGGILLKPTDAAGNFSDFTFGTGGALTMERAGTDEYEFRGQDGGFYSRTFKFRSRVAIGRDSITGGTTLDVGTSTGPPAAWFRNGVVVSNNPSGVSVDNTSMVIGAGNNDIVSGSDNCLAVGNNNQILANSDHSLAVGQGNTMNDADNSLVVGQQNTLTGNRLYVLGFSNDLTCESAFTMGGENNIGGQQNNCAVGFNNNIQGEQKNVIIGTSNSCGTGGSLYQQSLILGNNCTLGIPSSGTATEFGMVVIGSNNAQNYPGITSGQPFRPKIVLAADVGSGNKDALVISEGVNGIASMLHSDALLEHNFADDTAAAAGGVPVGALYHNAGNVRIRIV
jgi:hypothetical protein